MIDLQPSDPGHLFPLHDSCSCLGFEPESLRAEDSILTT